jgi:hypothetical protein
VRIVVVSDTHMPHSAKTIPLKLRKALEKADYILHAGDWCTMDAVRMFEAYAPVVGVAGNNDGRELAERFGLRKRIELGGVRIGIVHGHGYGGTTESRALLAFRHEPVDVILFGHSHVPLVRTEGDVLLFNPGSPTSKRTQPRHSFGVWNIENGLLRTKHVYF